MAAHHATFDTISKRSIPSSLTYTQSKLVMDDGYQIDPDILMPSYADSNKRRNLTAKSLTYFSSDLEQYVASGPSTLCPVDAYRVRTVSGDIENLKAENIAVRCRRLEQYLKEVNEDVGLRSQPADKQRSTSQHRQSYHDRIHVQRNHNNFKLANILTKRFGR